MGKKVRKKSFTEESVYEAALKRMNVLFDRFDTVTVSFSGGKDSTVALQLALEVAKERGRLPLDVAFWDEEAIHPPTIEYVERVRAWPEVRLKWLCLPVKHRNACSRKQPYWITWNPEEKEKWCRPLPEGAITEVKGFKFGMSIPEGAPLIYGPEHGTVCDVRGIRADESVRRYQSVAKRLKDNWLAGAEGHFTRTSPIYDWTTLDVWTAPKLFGWDYNRTYDYFQMAGVPLSLQRVCPPYGEEPLASLGLYHVCFPELWMKMVNRVHGAATAARYSRTELYGFGSKAAAKPERMTWREWTYRTLDLYPASYKRQIAAAIDRLIAMHQTKTSRSIPESEADPASGLSWQFLSAIAQRGDMKGRRAQNLTAIGSATMKKRGLTMESLAELNDLGTRY